MYIVVVSAIHHLLCATHCDTQECRVFKTKARAPTMIVCEVRTDYDVL